MSPDRAVFDSKPCFMTRPLELGCRRPERHCRAPGGPGFGAPGQVNRSMVGAARILSTLRRPGPPAKPSPSALARQTYGTRPATDPQEARALRQEALFVRAADLHRPPAPAGRLRQRSPDAGRAEQDRPIGTRRLHTDGVDALQHLYHADRFAGGARRGMSRAQEFQMPSVARSGGPGEARENACKARDRPGDRRAAAIRAWIWHLRSGVILVRQALDCSKKERVDFRPRPEA
jgi:hypothetical protein